MGMGIIPRRELARRTALAERFVDHQINNYLHDIRTKLDSLKTHFAELERAGNVLREEGRIAEKEETQRRWEGARKEVEKLANSLRSMLSYVFTGLKSKDDFKPRIDDAAGQDVFLRETRFMGKQIAESERRIVQYLFELNSTISLDELQGDNMVISLYRVRQMARALKGHF